MNLLIIHAHNCNRGDEAAVKSMVDEIILRYPNIKITISNNGSTQYPSMPENVSQIQRLPIQRSKVAQIEFFVMLLTKGKIAFTKNGVKFLNALREADLVIHAPGGPSIGDIYLKAEILYLLRFSLINKLKKPYMFYAPSMGPFNNLKRVNIRKKILLNAKKITIRDPISIEYIKKFIPDINVDHAMDSVLQHEIDKSINEKKLEKYSVLKTFLANHNKCLGITITDLKWHPSYNDDKLINRIKVSFKDFINKKVEDGFGIIFIPQLYGNLNDSNLMGEFMIKNHTFMIDSFDEKYDSYFQQFIIGKLYAVIGMRYHSNIFSAKMGTPFVSISYEQKMKGFMESINLSEYCIDVNNISFKNISECFDLLCSNYINYKQLLLNIHEEMKMSSYKSTKALFEILDNIN